jgi:hypothetical protein
MVLPFTGRVFVLMQPSDSATGQPPVIETHSRRLRATPWIKRLGGVVFVLLCSWLLVEALLRIGFGALPPGIRAAIENVRTVPWSDDTIAPLPPWVPDIDYQNMVPPGLDEYDLYFSDGHFTITTIDLWGSRIGFRSNPPDWPVQIVAVGDSFTFCFNDFEACWVQRLASDYGWSTMNLGQRGTGTVAHLNTLRSFGPPLEPEVVVWQWYGNDANEDYGFALMRGETEPLEVLPPIAPEPDYGWLADYSALYAALRDRFSSAGQDTPDDGARSVTIHGQTLRLGDPYNLYANDLSRPANQDGWQRTIAALEAAVSLVRDEMDAELLIVLMPTKEEVYAQATADAVGQAYVATVREGRLRLLDLCTARGWHCLDLTPALQTTADAGGDVFYNVDHHITDTGNQIVAQAVAEYVIEQGWLARTEK